MNNTAYTAMVIGVGVLSVVMTAALSATGS
jgi:hypothetical protein